LGENYFGVALKDLVYQDILDFFNQPQSESQKIEFKSYSTTQTFDQQIRVLFKSTCSFLNSEGGILIWGAPVGTTPPGQTEETFQGALSPIDQVVEKDRLINRLTDNITPAPSSIEVEILNSNVNYICVFEIAQSQYRPHQYNNNYYVRLDGQNRPAPHFLIESLFKQIKYPNLEGYLKITAFNIDRTRGRYVLKVDIAIFNFSEIENELRPSLRVLISKGLFLSCGSGDLRSPNFMDVLHFGQPYVQHETIHIRPDQFGNNLDLDFFLSFGGQKFPMKISKYKLNLENPNPNHLNDLIVEKKENKTLKEVQDELGSNREKALSLFLER